jgi:hypothetical protein
MSTQGSITQKSLGQRLWHWAHVLMRRVAGIRLRSETLMVIATCFSAIAAGGSFWAAVRQEKATYLSQLYIQQIQTISPIYPKLVPFDLNLRNWAWQKTSGTQADLSAFRDQVSGMHDLLDQQRALLLVTFPVTVTGLTDKMEKALDDVAQALEKYGTDDGHKALYAAWHEYTQLYSKLNDCVRKRLQSGQAIVYPMCGDEADS